ncbi:hypothetical protein [Lentzea sp. CA-135723]|uniref:hypothetical protein n=1 Tax=Lentzea sp. CA-135723 TaxID=3239950 RepID=UPI003D8AE6BF
MAARQGKGSLYASEGKIEVEFLGEFGAVRGRGRCGQSPEVVGTVSGARQTADGGFAVLDDGAELGVAEGVSSELAPRRKQGDLLAGRVVPVRELAVHLGRFEKVPIHEAKTYHRRRTYVRLDVCGVLPALQGLRAGTTRTVARLGDKS